MKKRRILSLFLICSLLCSLLLSVSASAYEDFSLDAKAGLLIEGETGEILYEKNAHQEKYPASITKITTALLVIEAIDAGKLSLSQEITANASAFAELPANASSAGIKAGEILTVEQLLYCLLVPSGNEAANILAEAVSGSVEAFVEQMNARVKQLGCEHTHYVNPHGLHDSSHYTTAWDIYLITREAMQHELFMTICNAKSYEIPATNVNDTPRTLHTTNYLISNWRSRAYLYSGAQGIKTGSTDEAGHCLVASAVRGSRQLISIVLGADRVTLEDGETIQTRSFSETVRLLDWGFDSFTNREIITADEPICEVPVALSSETNYVVARPAEDLSRMMPSDLDPALLERNVTLNQETVNAPIAAGDELGTLTLSYHGTVYGEVALVALSDVSASWILTMQYKIISFFHKSLVKVIAIVLVVAIAALFAFRIFFAKSRRYGRRRNAAHRSGYRGRRRR